MNKTSVLSFVFVVILLTGFSSGQVFDEDFAIWPTDLRIAGTVIVSNNSPSEELQKTFVDNAGRDEAKLVNLIFPGGTSMSPLDLEESETSTFVQHKLDSNAKVASTEVAESIEGATGVWISTGEMLTDENLQLLRALVLGDIVARSGVVLVDGPSSEVAGVSWFRPRDNGVEFQSGLGLVPDSLLCTNYDEHKRRCVLGLLSLNPNLVGIGVDKGTAIVLRGRKIRVYGENSASFLLAANEREPVKIKRMQQAPGRRANPYQYVLDLTAWRRQAIERQGDQFPAVEPAKPNVDKGTLLIVGGGGLPTGLMEEFIRLAGGDKARLVYIPCSERDEIPGPDRTVEAWKKAGVASAIRLHTKDRNKANGDNEFLAPLESATGIWFGGGRQWNFSDSWYGTKGHKLMKDVLHRGGVIGGSSAGASIQGRYLARANPLANFDIMAAGYERGLGFLDGVAIDQHFSQRGRHKDMTSLVDRYSQLLGIGIDETTALIVNGSQAKVVGKGQVFFYDRNQPLIPGQPDYLALGDGEQFDLIKRERVEVEIESETETVKD